MNIKKHIPNLITLGNLFCGILAVKKGFEMEFLYAAGFIILGATFDFFDGFAARLLKVSNDIGKQLDSLADMVTFGVAPGVIMFALLSLILNPSQPSCLGCIPDTDLTLLQLYLPYVAFLIPLSSAIRLAKFNVDENQSDKFIGLPTPANSLVFMSLPLIFIENLKSFVSPFTIVTVFITLIVLFSWLLNANIELLALKFKSFGWENNEFRFVFLGIAFIILIICILTKIIYLSIPIIILLYIIISIINNHLNLKHKQ
jgi:CDP-diacylglycerol--serine O-phosphatidyltransferase